MFDFLTWAGSSTCYVWDCQHAARILRAAIVEAEEIDTQLRAAIAQNASVADLHPAVYTRKQIHFAACGADETLPRVPGMPDDLFTACLTTPLRIALLFHNLETFPFTRSLADVQVQRSSDYMAELWDLMSHDLKTRLWCELQAILLTIAWQALDGREYQALFGQNGDVVSSLATGFLLSQRVMPAYHAHPESIPAILMPTNHPLWKHWDLILDNFFEQLPDYTAEGSLDPTWEAQLQLVSFMADQLNSIRTTDLSRLPIICRAALTRSHREPACVALDACLADLDIHGLDRAVQAGALDVAAELLALGDENVSPRMISIWASLVRHDECVMNLAKDGLQAERLTSVPAVEFFIRHLEENIDEQISGDKGVVVQSAAVLSTIAKFVAGRQATRLVTRSLRSAAAMLSSRDELVQQWGALLIAEVKGSIVDVDAEEDELIESLKLQLLGLGESDIVETRVSAVYALARWISASPIRDIVSLGPMLDLTHQLATQARNDGSAVVRKELARLFHRVLLRGGVWTTFTIWVYILQSAIRDIPSEKARCLTLMAEAGKKTGLTADQQSQMFRLTELIRLLGTLRQDPDRRVATLVSDSLSTLTADLRMHVQEKAWDAVFKIGFPSGPAEEGWTLESLASLKTAGLAFLADWDRRMAAEPGRVGDMPSQELFEKSKLSLQAYLAVGGS